MKASDFGQALLLRLLSHQTVAYLRQQRVPFWFKVGSLGAVLLGLLLARRRSDF